MLTISTMLAMPFQAGSRWFGVIGAAEGLPWARYTIPKITNRAPGMSVPISTPLEASLAITPIPPRSANNMPSQ